MSTANRFSGLRILVTGATSGIGKATAEALAREGATVLVHGRDATKVGPGGFVADLASLAETRRLAEEVLAEGPLDVLVNNAGVGFGRDRRCREVSADGFELRFAVNYLAPFVLSHALLAKGSPTRAIVNVASGGQEALDLDDLQGARYDGLQAYRRSKLALIMLSIDLAEAFPAVAVSSLHPGTFLDTAMVRDAGIAPRGPASRGAEAILHVLAAGQTGRYFDEQQLAEPDAQASDGAFRQALRERTLALLA